MTSTCLINGPRICFTIHSGSSSCFFCTCTGSVLIQVGDRYTLVKLLGHGSFSTVCLALDAFTEEKVLTYPGSSFIYEHILMPTCKPIQVDQACLLLLAVPGAQVSSDS